MMLQKYKNIYLNSSKKIAKVSIRIQKQVLLMLFHYFIQNVLMPQ